VLSYAREEVAFRRSAAISDTSNLKLRREPIGDVLRRVRALVQQAAEDARRPARLALWATRSLELELEGRDADAAIRDHGAYLAGCPARREEYAHAFPGPSRPWPTAALSRWAS
jgi:hypothetical protein